MCIMSLHDVNIACARMLCVLFELSLVDIVHFAAIEQVLQVSVKYST